MLELALDDDVGLGEALVDVALLEVEVRRRRCVGLSPFLPIASVQTSSCSSGASGFIASSTQVTAGSGSYSTLISLSASSATCGLTAATAATAWPL